MRDRKMRSANETDRQHDGEKRDHKGGRHQDSGQAANAEQGEQDGHGRGRHKHDHRGGRHGGGRDRARRGDARYILLDALRDGPKHGYEIIKSLEERSSGKYIPSPGTVYPTLQYLEDQGLVRSNQEAERRIFQLTEAGQAELDAQAEQVTAFWGRIGGRDVAAASQHEVNFLQDELEHLNRIVWSGLHTAIAQGQQDPIRRVRAVIEECQTKIREIIATEITAKEQTQ
jgi:DNA-binding PadR family transcriptional regulator